MYHQYAIRQIQESDWPAIVSIQSEVYTTVEPETEQVLRSKVRLGKQFCRVITDSSEMVVGYCLAHPWDEHPIVLDTIYHEIRDSQLLYIHDLAISPQHKGKGLGQMVVESLISAAKAHSLNSIKIIALRQALSFWEKVNFHSKKVNVDACYGDDAVVMIRNL